MNGRERIMAALRGQSPDRVPIMLHNFMMAAREAGWTQAQYRNDPQKVAQAFIQAVERYDYDGILVDIDTATLAGAVGVPVDYPEDEPGRCVHGCLESLDQVAQPAVFTLEQVQTLLRLLMIISHRIEQRTIQIGKNNNPFSRFH